MQSKRETTEYLIDCGKEWCEGEFAGEIQIFDRVYPCE